MTVVRRGLLLNVVDAQGLSHLVMPDDRASYEAHKTARATAHRNAACDAMEAALVEMMASYGAWTLWADE